MENVIYKETSFSGQCIDMIPVTDSALTKIVELRNQQRSQYFLNQSKELTYKDQKKWYDEYKKRDNDIYWVITDKNGDVIGTNRLYDITDNQCEQGSLIIDENRAKEAPYLVEAMLLTLSFAFDQLKVNKVINEDRVDNKVMNSITKRIGFTYLKDVEIRGATYRYYELTKENYKRDMLADLLNRWMER